MKYSIYRLSIEITRKCNLYCKHCEKGNMENVTIGKDIIDKMFSQIRQCNHISITGGETLLELDMLHYVVKAINKFNLGTKKLSMITNGSIQDERLIHILSDFVDSGDGRYVSLLISDDPFHDIKQSEKALSFYQSLDYNRLKIFIDNISNAVKLNNVQITYAGRAKKFIDENYKALKKEGIELFYPINSIRNHRICIQDESVKCHLELCANGNIGFCRCTEYETSDKLAIGNIMKQDLAEIIEKHNDSCHYLCDECFNESENIEIEKFFGTTGMGKAEQKERELSLLILGMRLNYTWGIRKLAKEKNPCIPTDELLHTIQVPSIKEWIELLLKLNNSITHDKTSYYQECKKHFPLDDESVISKISTWNSLIDILNRMENNNFEDLLVWDESLSNRFEKLVKRKNTSYVGNKSLINACQFIANTYDKGEDKRRWIKCLGI